MKRSKRSAIRTNPHAPCAQPFNVPAKPNSKEQSKLVPKRRVPRGACVVRDYRVDKSSVVGTDFSELRASDVVAGPAHGG